MQFDGSEGTNWNGTPFTAAVVNGVAQFRFFGDLTVDDTDVVSGVGNRPVSFLVGNDVYIYSGAVVDFSANGRTSGPGGGAGGRREPGVLAAFPQLPLVQPGGVSAESAGSQVVSITIAARHLAGPAADGASGSTAYGIAGSAGHSGAHGSDGYNAPSSGGVPAQPAVAVLAEQPGLTFNFQSCQLLGGQLYGCGGAGGLGSRRSRFRNLSWLGTAIVVPQEFGAAMDSVL